MKYLLIVFCFFFFPNHNCKAQIEIEHKIYDTEFGRFDLWVHGDQIAGSYEIAPKKIIGSMWAKLDGLTAVGRWTDPDGSGDIELTFENGFQKFKADYRSDEEPDKWYRDQWHGILKTMKEKENSPCSGPSWKLVKPFIGVWEEFELNDKDKEKFIGTLQVQLAAGGCSLVQRFISADSSFSYSTQGYVNPGSGFWEEKYVFSSGPPRSDVNTSASGSAPSTYSSM